MAERGEHGRACTDRLKRHAKKDARERRQHKGRTPHPEAEAVVRAAERAERQAGRREALAQVSEMEDDDG